LSIYCNNNPAAAIARLHLKQSVSVVVKPFILAASVALAAAAIVPASAAKWTDPHASWHSPAAERTVSSNRSSRSERISVRGSHGKSASAPTSSSGVGPRPSAWCGWYMRTRHGGGPEMNLAWNWRNYGSPGSPQIGAIVVWRHHVGEIVGQAANGQWLIHSGNDGGAVRTRARSIAGAVIRI
jgi:hypothetical protein